MSIQVTGDGKVTKDIIREGSGPIPQRGQKVQVHYVGTLTNGKKFDSSRDRGKPFEFTIGSGVIAGWSLGVATMKVGELSKFTIAADYAYGNRGFPGLIPPGSTLIFEIELLKIL
ncbi:peptidyl-prolyl cis-trans isomerase, FKBP-type family protein [Histomonas meleagridis]|uniref:peptidyl-prolyl cis-trans isomerase, FKBP-type family protein n=1 Tax=Histomonas meleagridis TaxID=135588 RepID=UPI00355A7AFC|nr:peptidyl-prolyl cis-trans isomerase, FKBP-type family protein [Histomonas meleagridis]KAH0801862.1 peptidyl-prolyl cis-trans isomerase, FKBP-type family protein [Histomonas meleagridis]